MSVVRKPEKMTLNEALGRFVIEYGDMPGFSGADISLQGEKSSGACLRLHVSGKSRHGAKLRNRAPKTYLGLRIKIVVADYDAEPRTPTVSERNPYFTSGAPCAGPRGGGQVALLVAVRKTNQLGFLTSWAAGASAGARIGAPVYGRPNPPSGELPIGYLAAKKLDRYGSAALCELSQEIGWLPIVRPSNQVITALKLPKLGEALSCGAGTGIVEGIGSYRMRHEVAPGKWKATIVDGFRLQTDDNVASGTLVFDSQLSTGVGMVSGFGKGQDAMQFAISSGLPRVFAELGLRLAVFDDLCQSPVRPSIDVVQANAGNFLNDPREDGWVRTGAGTRTTAMTANNRLDIATVVWPTLRAALSDETGRTFRVTDRLEKLDPMGGGERLIADAVNGSIKFEKLGLFRVQAGNFSECVTFDQACERIIDVLEHRAS